MMTQEERESLEKEWKNLQNKMQSSQFVDPKDVRRSEQITSLLMTDGESDSIGFNFVKGRGYKKSLNISKSYNQKGGKIG